MVGIQYVISKKEIGARNPLAENSRVVCRKATTLYYGVALCNSQKISNGVVEESTKKIFLIFDDILS